MLKAIILLFLFSFSTVFAQSKATIIGNIKSSENENLPGASISLEIKKQHYYAVSDTLGNFQQNISLGQLKITVTQLGYLQKSLHFDFVKDTIISIVLERDISLLKEVVIANDKKKGITN